MLAASGMAVVRATVGFLTFQLAFLLRSQKASVVWFGLVLLFSAIGTMVGNALGPIVRRSQHEERMLVMAFALIAVGGLVAALGGGQVSAALLAGAVGVAASFARLAFDAIVQRDAPDANRGRAFAQFETRFQIAWVMAAFVPVIIPIPRTIGFLIVTVLAASALASYVLGWRNIQSGLPLPPTLGSRVRAKVKERRRTGRGSGRTCLRLTRRRAGRAQSLVDLEPGQPQAGRRRPRPGWGRARAEVQRRVRPSSPSRSMTPSTKATASVHLGPGQGQAEEALQEHVLAPGFQAPSAARPRRSDRRRT